MIPLMLTKAETTEALEKEYKAWCARFKMKPGLILGPKYLYRELNGEHYAVLDDRAFYRGVAVVNLVQFEELHAGDLGYEERMEEEIEG